MTALISNIPTKEEGARKRKRNTLSNDICDNCERWDRNVVDKIPNCMHRRV